MLLSDLAKTCALLAISLIAIQPTKAQPLQYNKIFHPQTQENIAVMKKSPQKMVIAYSLNPETIAGDSAKYINFIKKYNEDGRLVSHHDYLTNSLIKYSYDKKGRVIAYYEELIDLKPLLNFTITYTKRGAITSIKNRDKTKQAQSISYNSNKKTILISDVGGYIYKYTLNNKNLLVETDVQYYQSTQHKSTLTYNKKKQVIEEKGRRVANRLLANFTTKYTYEKGLLKKDVQVTVPLGFTEKSILTQTYIHLSKTLMNKVIETGSTKLAFSYFYNTYDRPIRTTYSEGGMLLGQEYYVYR